MKSDRPGVPIPFTATSGTVYEMVGGMETFKKLADAFYTRVEADDFLFPMFGARSMAKAREHLALFLAQFFGGPTQYSDKRGHPRLKMRHIPFKIGQAERDAWLGHMLAALDEVGIQEPALTPMRRYLDQTATFLINADQRPTTDDQ
jgi:hemoglobin